MKRNLRALALTLGLLALIFASPLHAKKASEGEKAESSTIQWQEWGQQAFQQAQAEDKLIVMDLTAIWCHACHVMDQTTYANPRIINLLNSKFIPIRVDSDQRPDLESRYQAGGWPTTSVLLPTGEILFQANAMEPAEMETVLEEVHSIYARDKASLLEEASRLWKGSKEKSRIKTSQENPLHVAMIRQSIEVIKQQYDAVHGGFQDAPKFFEPEAIQMVFAHGFFENDPKLIQIGLDTLTKQMPLLDPVWGGFYRYAEKSDWTEPHFEKLLTVQAWNLRNYIEAYQLTGTARFQHVALALINYVSRFLRDNQTGLFYESQDADVRNENEEMLLSGAEYYSLTEKERLAHGLPNIDKRQFTGSNALMVQAYLHASPVLGKPEMQVQALQTLNHLFETRFDKDRGLVHVGKEAQGSVYGLLIDHVMVGQALLEAFSATGKPQFLQKSETLAGVTQQLLKDFEKGGFYDHPRSPDKLGLLKLPAKPVRENLQAARWYLSLFHITEKPEYLAVAEATLQSVLTSTKPLPIGLAGLAVNQWFRVPVHIAVVGLPNDPGTKELIVQSRRLYCPGKIVKIFDPRDEQPKWGEIVFPFDGRPVAFVCTDQLCLAPVFQPAALKENLSELLAMLKKDPILN